MNKYTFLASTVLLAITSQGLAQSVTDDRFCKQYANQVTDISKEAIAKNKSCLDFSRGVHTFHQMHYNWCLKNTRETVYGAADNIGRLVDQCTSAGISQSGSSQGLAQSVTDDRFCKQYASQVTEISRDAIARNKSCLDYKRGVHTAHQMHYNWCLKNTRDTVYGAADNIGRLADQCTSLGISQSGSSDKLGRVWYEQESGWSGTWARVGNSSRFQATWTHPNGGTVKADLTITLQGENVQVIRRDTFGPHTGRGCKYTGRLQGNRVSGKYSCDWAGGQILWSAQISQ